MKYNEVVKAGADIITGFQKRGIDPIDAMGILVTALVLLRRTTNVHAGIEETAETIRLAMINTDKDVDDSKLVFDWLQ